MPPTPNSGRMATPSTMKPMPPSHCVSARQNSTLLAFDSISVITDAPVVVKPDIDSKYASTGFGRLPANR